MQACEMTEFGGGAMVQGGAGKSSYV